MAEGAKSYDIDATDTFSNDGSDTFSVTIDNTAPSISIATASTNKAYLDTGTNTLYFKGDTTGDFTLAATVTDAASGAKSTTYPAIATTDWTHGAETVTGSSPYTSASFSWTSTTNVPGSYTVTAVDQVGNSVSATAISFSRDVTAPSISIATASTNKAYLDTGTNTLYFKGDTTGDFTLAATVSDAASGAKSTTYPAIATTDWTHGAETVTGSSPYTSASFSWTSTTNVPGSYTVTAVDQVGNSVSATAISFSRDVTAPSLTVATGSTDGKEYLSGTTLYFKGNTSGSFTFSSTVSDGASGVQKTNYPATSGGTWSNFTHSNQDVTGGSPHVSSSISWSSVGAGDSYVVTLYDNVGNTATSTITFTSDVTAPSLTVATGSTDGKEYLSGSTLYFKGNTSGSFTFSSTVSDGASGVQKTNYPATSGGTWSNFTHSNQDVTGGSPHVSSSISWSSVGAGDSYVVTLYDNVGNTATSTITFTSDVTAPSLTVATGSTDGKEYLSGTTLYFKGNTSGSFTFSSTVSDGASGVQKTNYPATSGGTWSNFTHSNQDVTGGSPHVSSSISWSSVGAGDSYVVTLYDNVGNTATSTITFTSDVTAPSLTVATGSTDGKEYLSGSTLYFKGNTSGSFTFSSTVSDGASGVQKTNYPATSGGTWSNFTHSNQDVTGGSPHVSSSISWSSVGAGDSYVVTLYDNVGNTATSTITFTSDVTAPSLTVATGSTDGKEYLSGTTLYFKGNTSGSFTFSSTVSDGASGVQKTNYPATSGGTWSNFTHSNQDVTGGSPHVSSSISWSSVGAGDSYVVTLYDNVGNTATSTITFTSDTTAPTASDVACANTGVVRKYEVNEVITLTFSEAVDPASIASGWNGSARTVTVKITDQAGHDPVTFFDGAGTGTPLPLGSIDNGSGGYTGQDVTFDSSSMSLSGSVLSITLGAPNRNVTQAGGTSTVVWTPSGTVTDRVGNAMSTSPLSKPTSTMC